MKELREMKATVGARGWAMSSLTAGLIWMAFALAPIPLTTFLGLPFAGYALVVGWLSRRASQRGGDTRGARQAGWGVGLGCAGLVYVVIVNTLIASLLLTGAWMTISTLINGTPTPR
jgi:hypothetical protein